MTIFLKKFVISYKCPDHVKLCVSIENGTPDPIMQLGEKSVAYPLRYAKDGCEKGINVIR